MLKRFLVYFEEFSITKFLIFETKGFLSEIILVI